MFTLEIGKPLPFVFKSRLLWKSEIMKIGYTNWIYVVYEKDDELLNWRTGERGTARYTAYMYLNEWDGWRMDRDHPRYDSNDGMYAGLPKSLRKLYDRNEKTVQSLLHPEPAPSQLDHCTDIVAFLDEYKAKYPVENCEVIEYGSDGKIIKITPAPTAKPSRYALGDD